MSQGRGKDNYSVRAIEYKMKGKNKRNLLYKVVNFHKKASI